LEISISCIHAKPETNVSTKADVARRLLLTSSDIANRTKTLRTCKDTLERPIAVKYHMTNGMSWRDRLRHWVRWTSATSKSPKPQKEPGDTSPQQAVVISGTANEVESEEPFRASSAELPVSTRLSQAEINQMKLQNLKKPSGYVYWDRKTSTATSVIVGHVLHEVPAVPEVATKSAVDATAQRTMFHPTAVNISRLFGIMSLLNNLPKTSLVLRFTPSPWTAAGPEVLTSLPPVEMHFAVNPTTKELNLKDVLAVVESTASEVMLPDRILDLRFQQRTTTRLRTLHRNQLPQILEFLKASQLNLMRGRLETPPVLTLPIANHLCNVPESETLQNSVNGSISAEYIFGGLEYRSTLAFDFKGWQLLYTSIEGGKADGRRGELSLRPRRVIDDISDSNKSSTAWTEEFLEAAYLLVDTLEGYDSTPGRSVSSSTMIHDTNGLPGFSCETAMERNKAFRYFRQRINFIMKHAVEDESSEEAEKYASVDLGDVAEGCGELDEEFNGAR
jgi:hypothetical protein